MPVTVAPGGIIDRVSPTRRPDATAVMRQRWARLLFLHWPMPPDVVAALIPRGLDLDVHEGQAWIGLVPFVVTGARPVLLPPVPGVSTFDEVNVRTYVHVSGADPGVWFFSLDASSRVAVAAARTLFKLAYRYAEMSAEVDGARVRFRSERVSPGPLPARCAVEYAPRGEVAHAVPGTLEHFLVERYILYAADGERLYQGRVHHAPYPVRGATVSGLSQDIVQAAGLPAPRGEPLAHYASEVDVEVFPIRRVS
jgi:uncharacterized protein